MKKLLVMLGLVMAIALPSGKAFASEIVDTGGGDPTGIKPQVIQIEEDENQGISNESTKSSDSSDQLYEKNQKNFERVFNNMYENELVPDVDAESFFKKLNSKLFETGSNVQYAGAIVVAIMFIGSLIYLGVACFASKKHIPSAVVSVAVTAIAFCGVVYSMDILTSFSTWVAM